MPQVRSLQIVEEHELPPRLTRDELMRPLCPHCGAVVLQCEKVDLCERCGWKVIYP